MTFRDTDWVAAAADGPVTFRFRCGEIDTASTCTVTKGKYVRGGALPDGTTLLYSASAKLVGQGDTARDSFEVQFVIAPDTVPATVPDIVFAFGNEYSRTVPGSSFTRRGTVLTFRDGTNALPSITVDFAKGTITVKGKDVGLGPFVAGGQPVRFVIGPVGEPAVIDVRMSLNGSKLSY